MVTIRPHIGYRLISGEGILSGLGQQQSTTIQSISPGALFEFGQNWNLDYTATQTYYSDSAFDDSLDHSLNLAGGAVLQDWMVQFGQSFTLSSPVLIETARQTKESVYGTRFSAAHNFGNKTQIDLEASYQARFSAQFPDSREAVVGGRFHYQFTPRLDSSVNLSYGTLDMSSGVDMTFVRPGVSLDWKPTEKIAMTVQAGNETRHFKSSGADNLNVPTYSGSLAYRPFSTTTVSVNASRGVTSSYFESQVTKNSSWGLGLQQRLLQHFYLGLGYSQQKSNYVAAEPSISTNRGDRIHSFNARLSTTFLQRATGAIFYQDSRNSSSTVGYNFDSTQFGLELAYRF